MKPTLKNLTLAAAVLTMTVVPPGVGSNFAAFAQATAPSAATTLPEASIKALQEALNGQGIVVKADGIFNDETRAAIREYQLQHHLIVTGEPDKATLDKLGVERQRTDLPAAAPTAGARPGTGGQGMAGQGMAGQGMGRRGMGGQGMMGQGMMGQGMMGQGMMAQGGSRGMMGAPGAGMGPGMMGQMPMAGGMMMCPTMPTMGARAGMNMPGMMGGPALLYGTPHGIQEEMTPERVRAFVEQHLAWHGNPRLKLGPIGIAADGSITAEIVTVDGSLVQKLAFNRYPGLFRQIVD